MKVVVQRLEDPPIAGQVWRAYRDGLSPLYIGGVSPEDCRQRVLIYYPDAEVEIKRPEAEHPPDEAIDTSDIPEIGSDFFAGAVLTQPGEPLPVHEHHPTSVEPAQPPPGLRRTGVFQIETCRCGMKRHVWLTSFKIDAGAWQ